MNLLRIQKQLSAPSRRITLAGVVLIGLTIVAAGLATWERREAAIDHYRDELSQLNVVLAEQTARSIQAIDLVLLEVQAKAAAADIASPDDLSRSMGGEDIRKFLVERLQNLPQAVAIAVVGANGIMLNGSMLAPPAVDLSDRDYFLHFRDQDDPGVYISTAHLGRVSGAWTFMVARRVNDRAGRFAGIVVILADIRHFEEFYQAITPSEGEAITLLRRDGTVLARHPHMEKLLGAKLSEKSPWYEVIAHGGGSYFSPGFINGIPRLVAAMPIREYPLAIDIGISEAEALAVWRHEALLISLTAGVAVLAYIALFAALSARTRAIEDQSAELVRSGDALRYGETRFRDFALTSSDWFWETGPDHRFTFISDGIRRFGHDPDDRIGKSRLDFAADVESEPGKWEQHVALLNRHEPFRNLIYARKAGGSRPDQIVSVSGSPFFDDDGNFLGYRGTGSDVTEKIRAERRLDEARIEAEAANIAKSQFLANMSHELRTPLNAIIGFSDMLATGIAGPDRQQEYTEIIRKSGMHLLGVINDVLDLAKIDANKFTLHEEVIDPSRLIKECVSIVREPAYSGSVQLSAEGGVPPVAVLADNRRLKQVLLNLLSNAVKFTEAGGSVTAGFRRGEDGALLFEVRDSGIGMTPDEVTIALQPFGQVDGSLGRRHEGTGLGLPLARSLVELHGGSLLIDSARGRGTTVTIALPASRARGLAELPEPPTALAAE